MTNMLAITSKLEFVALPKTTTKANGEFYPLFIAVVLFISAWIFIVKPHLQSIEFQPNPSFLSDEQTH